MKPQTQQSFNFNLTRIFLFLAILKVIDFGFVDTSACYSGDLPWKVTTEYLQEKEIFQDKDSSFLDVFDVAKKAKTSGDCLHFNAHNQHQNRFFNYRQKLTRLINPDFSSAPFHLVTSKSNIPHLNLDVDDPLGFQPEVV